MRSRRVIIAGVIMTAGVIAAPSASSAPARTESAVTAAAVPDPNTYPVVLGGDFTADYQGDLFFHSPSGAPDLLYDFNPPTDPGGGLDIYVYAVKGSYRPVVGRFGNDNSDDIVWYQPGSGGDVIWDFNPCGFCPSTPTYTRLPISVNGTYTPVAGNFASIQHSSILWYGDGTRSDAIWDFKATCTACQPTHRSRPITVNGSGYRPVAGNFLGDPGSADEVFWYSPSGAESMWTFAYGTYQSIKPAAIQVSGSTYSLAVADLFADMIDDIVFLGPGSTQDSVWDFYAGSVYKSATPEPIGGGFTTVVGVPIGARGREPGEFYEDFFVYDPAGTTGGYYDIYWNNDEQAFFYDRFDFDPVPLTELPPDGPLAPAGAPEGRRWIVP